MRNWHKTLLSTGISVSFSKMIFGPVSVGHLAVMSAHETGHYMAAKSLNLNPSPPVILGLGPVNFGFVVTERGTDSQRRYVASFGPLGGITASICVLSLSALIGSSVLAFLSLACLMWELNNLFIGPDSKKVFR
jgi:hypothetical protein